MADDAADTVASVLAQAFTLYEKSIGDAKAAFKKTVVDDRQTQTVVLPLDVMLMGWPSRSVLYSAVPSPPASVPIAPRMCWRIPSSAFWEYIFFPFRGFDRPKSQRRRATAATPQACAHDDVPL